MAIDNVQRIISLEGTKANCEAFSATLRELVTARATDTGEFGIYLNSTWHWFLGTGNVVGPASAVNENIAVFDSTTGKLIKDGGYTIATLLALIAAGSGKVLMADGITPPDPLTTEDETDWLYEG